MLLLFDLDDTLYSKSEQLGDDYTPEKDLAKIVLFPGVKELLKEKVIIPKITPKITSKIKAKMVKVLVTKGDKNLQQQKIDCLKIKNLFDKIMFCARDEDKKKCFAEAIAEFPHHDEVWVIGNRLDSEIRYGKELGLKTIYLRHGKYSQQIPRDAYEVPDYEIKNFADVARILTKQTTKDKLS